MVRPDEVAWKPSKPLVTRRQGRIPPDAFDRARITVREGTGRIFGGVGSLVLPRRGAGGYTLRSLETLSAEISHFAGEKDQNREPKWRNGRRAGLKSSVRKDVWVQVHLGTVLSDRKISRTDRNADNQSACKTQPDRSEEHHQKPGS